MDAFMENDVVGFLGQNRCRYQCVDALAAYIAMASMTERRSSSDTIHLESSASRTRVDYLYRPQQSFHCSRDSSVQSVQVAGQYSVAQENKAEHLGLSATLSKC